MNISKRKQGILAIICTIAMIVTSITVYNPREAKAADTDYSALKFTKVTEAMDSTYAYCITDNTLIDFGKLNFYGVNYMQVVGSENSKMDKATVTIDGVVQTNKDIAFDRASAITGFIVSKLSDNAYHKIEIAGEAGKIIIVLKKGTPSTGGSESSSGGTTKPEETTTQPRPTMSKDSAGIVIEIRNGGLFFAGLDNIKDATEYYLYVDKLDGEGMKVENGGTIPLYKFEAGKHSFYVKGKNSAGFSEPSKAFEIEIATTVKLIIDNGTVVNTAVEKGKTYKLPTSAQYGYYDTKTGDIYKAGSDITVSEEMNLVSIYDIVVRLTNAAAIRIDAGKETPGGIRFQASVDVNCGVSDYKDIITDKVKAGTLITTQDILDAKSDVEYKVENIKELGTVLNVENDGWIDKNSHLYNASLVNIVKANYDRYFVAKAYVKVTYADESSTYVYSKKDNDVYAESVKRSISDIGKAIYENGYDGITDGNTKNLINSFIVKKEQQ